MKKYDCFAYNPRFKNACEALKDAYCSTCKFYKTRKEHNEKLKKVSEKNT